MRIIASSLVLVIVTAIYAEDWAKWRGPNNNGISSETKFDPKALSPAPKILWKTEVGEGYASVSVCGKMLYTMGNQGNRDTVYCLNAETGEKVWTHSYPCPAGSYPGTRATPVVDGDKVYTVSRDGHTFCLDAEKGTVIWKSELPALDIKKPKWGLASSPCIFKDLLIINTGLCGMALNKETGAVVWKSSGESSGGYATPVVYTHKDKYYAAIFGSESLYVVDINTGRPQWALPWPTKYGVNASDPIVDGGRMFISSGYDQGCALLDLQAGRPKVVWQNKNMRNHFSSTLLIDGYLYGIDGQAWGGAKLKCLDFKTGAQMWEHDLEFGNLIAADGKLIVLNHTGILFIAKASPTSYQELARAQVITIEKRGATCWTAPVLCRGLIYCRSSGGDLVCVDVR